MGNAIVIAIPISRPGSKRAVNVAKRCYMRIVPRHRLDEIDDTWLAWGYQANFMYALVLWN